MTSEGLIQQRVVVGVDGSAESVAALGWAAKYAQQAGATVRAVLAWHYPGAVGGPPMEHSPLRPQTEQQMQDRLNEAIAQVYPEPGRAAWRPRSATATRRRCCSTSPPTPTCSCRAHGHGGFVGMHIGSVSIHCVNAAHCPVTVVRSKS